MMSGIQHNSNTVDKWKSAQFPSTLISGIQHTCNIIGKWNTSTSLIGGTQHNSIIDKWNLAQL